MAMEDLPFRIDQWDAADGRIERTLAFVDGLVVARDTFISAVKHHGGSGRITLRQGARVIEQHPVN